MPIPPLTAQRTAMTVSQLVYAIKDLLETGFPDVYIEGEISDFAVPASGHFYFTLKDEKARISGVMFRMQNRLIRFRPENGMQVIARGRVTSYPPRGSMQIIIDFMEPKGAGDLAAAFEQRKKDLAEKGYFDQEKKKPLPPMPFTIGIVTSPTAAALYDALRIAYKRSPDLHVILSPTLVQGDKAAGEIAQAIKRLEEDGRSEVILVIRGGGSAEDLWAFNELQVAEAIYQCEIPVISGVGHEVDFTIADFVADLRAPTPTAAAEMAVPKISDALHELQRKRHQLIQAFSNKTGRAFDRFENLRHRLIVRGMPSRISAQRLDELSGRLARAARTQIHKARIDLERTQDRAGTLCKNRLHKEQVHFGSLIQRLRLVRPDRLVEIRKERLGVNLKRLVAAQQNLLEKNERALGQYEKMLAALSPKKILERGYSITRTADGKIVTDATRVEVKQDLEVLLHKGRLNVEVKDKTTSD